MTIPAPTPPASPELQAWLESRQHAKDAKRYFQANDGPHFMLRESVVDPEKLPEPLRSQAIAYLRATE